MRPTSWPETGAQHISWSQGRSISHSPPQCPCLATGAFFLLSLSTFLSDVVHYSRTECGFYLSLYTSFLQNSVLDSFHLCFMIKPFDPHQCFCFCWQEWIWETFSYFLGCALEFMVLLVFYSLFTCSFSLGASVYCAIIFFLHVFLFILVLLVCFGCIDSWLWLCFTFGNSYIAGWLLYYMMYFIIMVLVLFNVLLGSYMCLSLICV